MDRVNVVDGSISSPKGKKKMEPETETETDPSDDFDIARMALSVKDFSLAKTYALRILGQYKNLSVLERARADQILAIAQVLLAPPSDLYAVLQLNRETFSPETLALRYRRLAHLLDPQLNPFAYASKGFKLVAKAYSVLSSPQKKSEYDAGLMRQDVKKNKESADHFWTVCKSCFHIYAYQRIHVDKSLRCQNRSCGKVFVAEELPVEPPVVEGTDMYYATWAFYPVGFPSGYRFHHEEAEKKRVQETRGRRQRHRQTARKTVRPVDFISIKSSNNDISGEEEEEEVPGMQPPVKKQKQRARKTVRSVDFCKKLRSCRANTTTGEVDD